MSQSTSSVDEMQEVSSSQSTTSAGELPSASRSQSTASADEVPAASASQSTAAADEGADAVAPFHRSGSDVEGSDMSRMSIDSISSGSTDQSQPDPVAPDYPGAEARSGHVLRIRRVPQALTDLAFQYDPDINYSSIPQIDTGKID